MVAQEAALAARPIALRHFRKQIAVDDKSKGGTYDPVTVADRQAEQAIRKILMSAFPDHAFLGEETGTAAGTSPYQWVVDPIDGTRAYIMGSPMWGTLIGLLHEGTPVLGILDHAFTGEMLWSSGGVSRLRHGNRPVRKLKTRSCGRLADAVFGSTHPDLFESPFKRRVLGALKAKVRMTRYGGDCYGYGLLAQGFIDVIVETGLKPFDIVALIPIVEAAGGRVTTWTGEPAASGGDIVATGDARVHEEVLQLITSVA